MTEENKMNPVNSVIAWRKTGFEGYEKKSHINGYKPSLWLEGGENEGWRELEEESAFR